MFCQTTSPTTDKAAHTVRIPSVRDDTDLIASVLIALETGDAATFDLQARAERGLHQAEYRPTIRLVMDGWCWFLTPEQAHLVALALRLDVEIVGRDHLSAAQRDTLTDLVADAFEAAIRDADTLAAARNAAGDLGPVPLFAVAPAGRA